MKKTAKNLEEAFAGESQANRKYLAFATKADREGYTQVAKLFRAAAEAETVHAHAHLRALGGIRTTAENLKEALAGETHEFKKMYPDMIEEARNEGEDAALKSFSYANEVEEIHAGLYQKALEQMEKMETVDYYVCSVCGYTCEGQPPDICPVCKSKSQAFFKTK
ncbi:MAG TPA: rubrerythrin family protein [Desulfobacteraceae bacterium]|mgnify:CR=1 FL=1|nr:rubrerythrin family protein [Desulfobacteraceae bacterium]